MAIDVKAREAAQRALSGIRGDGAGEDGEKKFLNWENGVNTRRFLPWPGHDTWFHEARVHWYGGQPILCLTETWLGKSRRQPVPTTKCPLCRRMIVMQAKVNKKYPRGDEVGKKKWGAVSREYGSRLQFYANAFDPEADEPEVKPVVMGPMIMDYLLDEYINNEIDFVSIKFGRTMTIKRKKLGEASNEVKYTVSRGDEKISISAEWAQIKDSLPDLAEAPPKPMAVQDIKDLMEAFEVSDEEEAPRRGRGSKRGDEDESDEETASRDVASVTKKKPSCFGDPDTHNPEDEICQECPFFSKCKKTEAVAEAYEEGRYEGKKENSKVKALKKKLKRVSGEDDSSDEEDED